MTTYSCGLYAAHAADQAISQSTGRILSQAIAELNAAEYAKAGVTLQPLLEQRALRN